MYPIGDFLIKLKNAQDVKKSSVNFKFSKKIFNIAKILERYKLIDQVAIKEKNNRRFIRVKLNYINDFPLIKDIKLISKPGRRIYIKHKDIKKVKQGYGIGIISTSQGILSDSEAKKNNVGGEYIAEIW